MIGTRTWFSARATCPRHLTGMIGLSGDWRMIPTIANGQLAVYHRDGEGIYRAFGFGVLSATDTGIARIHVFGGDANLVAKFGLPAVRLGTKALAQP